MPKLPGVNHQDAVRALESAGYRIARQGKHIVTTNDIYFFGMGGDCRVNRWVFSGY
jgi:hypothetical protein